MRCIIVLNGKIKDYSAFEGVAREGDFIICADGGLRHAKKLGLKPHLIMGDFDSFNIDDVPDGKVLRFPIEKDKTDGEIAVEYALDKGFEEILLIGALGGRTDHLLANVLLLEAIEKAGKKACIMDCSERIYCINAGIYKFEAKKGDIISIIPISESVEGISLLGFYYPLESCDIKRGSTHGISNIFEESTGSIEIKKGTVIVVVSGRD